MARVRFCSSQVRPMLLGAILWVAMVKEWLSAHTDQELNLGVCTSNGVSLRKVLVYYGCCNKIPKIGWMKTTDNYCLSDLEVRCLKSRHQQGHGLPDGSRGEYFLASSNFWYLLMIPGSPWFVDASFQSYGRLLPLALHTVFLLCMSMSIFLHLPSPLFVRTPVIGLGPPLILRWWGLGHQHVFFGREQSKFYLSKPWFLYLYREIMTPTLQS